MINATVFDDLAKAFEKVLPPGANEFRADVEKNAKSAFQSAFGKLDLVTREEFDVQSKVLARTRAKLEALEARVAAMESAASGAADQDTGTSGTENAAQP